MKNCDSLFVRAIPNKYPQFVEEYVHADITL